MGWNGVERRLGRERRAGERRRTMRYDVAKLVIIDGITWIDSEAPERRQHIRRHQDRESVARKLLEISRP